jgi:preprotein translocase subunit SecE
MAKIAAVPAPGDERFSGIGGRIKNAWSSTIGFFRDVRTEMRKVTTPSLKEVQATTAVVIITVAIFGVFFFLIDNGLNAVITKMLNYFTK